MGDVRPTYEENYALGLEVRRIVGNKKVVVCPVDHGAFEDAKYLREPLNDAGVNALWYKRGPYSMPGCLSEGLQRVMSWWYDSELEDCLDQSNMKRFGEYRMIWTPLREIEKFVERNGGADYFLGFEDWMDSGVSGMGLYVFGRMLATRGVVKDSFVAASSDSTGGLANFAAKRLVERSFTSPESYVYHNAPRTYAYLLRKGAIRDIKTSEKRESTKRKIHPSSEVLVLPRLFQTAEVKHDDRGTGQ